MSVTSGFTWHRGLTLPSPKERVLKGTAKTAAKVLSEGEDE